MSTGLLCNNSGFPLRSYKLEILFKEEFLEEAKENKRDKSRTLEEFKPGKFSATTNIKHTQTSSEVNIKLCTESQHMSSYYPRYHI